MSGWRIFVRKIFTIEGVLVKTALRNFLGVFLLVADIVPLHAQWVQTNGWFDGRVYSFAVSDTNLFAVEDGGILRSTDGGANWTMLNPNGYFDALAVKDNNLFVGSYSGVYLSTDNGASWNSLNNGLSTNIILSLAVSGKNLFAGTGGGGVFLSTNNGTSWTSVSSGLTNSTIWALYVSGNNLFAGTQNGIFLTTNDGSSWTPVDSGLTNRTVDAFIACGNSLFAATWGGGIFVSTDNGTEWKAVNTGLQNRYVISFAVSGTNLFAGSAVGIFQSTDMGSSWKPVSIGLAQTIVYSLTIYGDNLLAGTAYNGVWKRPLSEMITSIENDDRYSPLKFKLEQNYPNPFNPSTKISYNLSKAGHVTLRVYDVLGREVATLVNENQYAGTHVVHFDGSSLASGVYFYRLQAGDYSAAKKLLLLK